VTIAMPVGWRTANERIPILLQIPAAKRFVSVEPMLENINLTKYLVPHLKGSGNILYGSDWNKLDWVICGCESSLKRRKTEIDWIRNLRDQCSSAGIPFFLKQMEVNGKIVKMPKLDGQEWGKFPQ